MTHYCVSELITYESGKKSGFLCKYCLKTLDEAREYIKNKKKPSKNDYAWAEPTCQGEYDKVIKRQYKINEVKMIELID